MINVDIYNILLEDKPEIKLSLSEQSCLFIIIFMIICIEAYEKTYLLIHLKLQTIFEIEIDIYYSMMVQQQGIGL